MAISMLRRITYGTLFLAFVGIFYFSTLILESTFLPATELDLSGIWEVCLSKQTEGCHWHQVAVPAPGIPKNLKTDFQGWLVYRKAFVAPANCLSPKPACSLFLGEVGDMVEARLNGIQIGRLGNFPPETLYAKHYPARFHIPYSILKPAPQKNLFELVVYSMKNVQEGIRRGPIGIFAGAAGFRLARTSVVSTILIPILGFVALFFLGSLTALLVWNEGIQDARPYAFINFCTASAMFLLSFSEVPREYIPIWMAGYLHFALRILHDWAYFEVVCVFFDFGRQIRLIFRPCYALILVAFIVAFIHHATSAMITSPGIGFDNAYLIMRIAVPLLVLPHVLGFIGSARLISLRQRYVSSLFFLVMGVLQIHDSLVFHGYLVGQYFVKIYPLTIGIYFGWMLFGVYRRYREDLLLRERMADIVSQVAHDVRGPLAALKMATHDADGLSVERHDLISRAIDRISAIASDLLETYRRDIVQETFLPPLLEQIIEEKRSILKDQTAIELNLNCIGKREDMLTTAHPGELRRIFSNLADNAIQAIRKAGVVDIECSSHFGKITVVFRDNGVGIPAEVLGLISQKRITYGKEQGTGIALYSARKKIEGWGGAFKISSSKDTGTAVILTFRAARNH